MAGWEGQQTRDAGQAIVEAELARAGFLVGRLDPDLGEDLWAEVDGRRASASGELPLRALFQVKATAEAIDECILDVEVDHLKRWAAQPLPVFVVGVSTATQRLSGTATGHPPECTDRTSDNPACTQRSQES
jgi:hypothetical protein